MTDVDTIVQALGRAIALVLIVVEQRLSTVEDKKTRSKLLSIRSELSSKRCKTASRIASND